MAAFKTRSVSLFWAVESGNIFFAMVHEVKTFQFLLLDRSPLTPRQLRFRLFVFLTARRRRSPQFRCGGSQSVAIASKIPKKTLILHIKTQSSSRDEQHVNSTSLWGEPNSRPLILPQCYSGLAKQQQTDIKSAEKWCGAKNTGTISV